MAQTRFIKGSNAVCEELAEKIVKFQQGFTFFIYLFIFFFLFILCSEQDNKI